MNDTKKTMKIKPFKEPIYITRPILPDLDELQNKLKRIWESKQVTNIGGQHKELNEKLKIILDTEHVILFNNGTTALMIALKSLGLSGQVITTPFTFPATIHALTWNNLEPVFCDIDKKTLNLNPNNIEKLITPDTSAILGVHLFGNPCNTSKIQEIADRHGLKIIYDAAHAFGVKSNNQSIGNYGDISIFSFHATKLFHAIEGGAAVTRDNELRKKCELFRNFGIKEAENIVSPGINGKLNELQAAIGIMVLERIEEEMEKRMRLIDKYKKMLENIRGIGFQQKETGTKENYQYFVLRINREKFGISRDEVFSELNRYNVFPSKYFFPLCSTYPHYKHLPSSDPDLLRQAHLAAREIMAMPLYGELAAEDVERICTIIINLRR